MPQDGILLISATENNITSFPSIEEVTVSGIRNPPYYLRSEIGGKKLRLSLLLENNPLAVSEVMKQQNLRTLVKANPSNPLQFAYDETKLDFDLRESFVNLPHVSDHIRHNLPLPRLTLEESGHYEKLKLLLKLGILPNSEELNLLSHIRSLMNKNLPDPEEYEAWREGFRTGTTLLPKDLNHSVLTKGVGNRSGTNFLSLGYGVKPQDGKPPGERTDLRVLHLSSTDTFDFPSYALNPKARSYTYWQSRER